MVTNNTKRIENQEKLYAYYSGQEDEVLSYLETALNVTFNADDIQEFQKDWINITKKTVNQLATVYRDPANRRIFLDKTENKDLTQYYLRISPANQNTIDKSAHRLGKLLNTSLTRVYFDKGIKYSVLPSHLYDVKVDDSDPYKPIEVAYPKDFNVNGKTERFQVVWTATEHYKVPLFKYNHGYFKGDKQPVFEGQDMVNPYGIIPFGILRLEEQNDFWGCGLSDLVTGNEIINVILTELVNEQIIMGTAGTTLAVNLNLQYKKEDGSMGLKKVRTGRKHPIVVEQNDKDKTPRLEHITTQPFITEIRDTVDWKIKMIAMSKGLNPNSFLADVKATSGYSKAIDALEQLEIRRDDIEPCRIYEEERFNIVRKVNNYHATTKDKGAYGLMEIPEKASLVVDFIEPELPKNIDETIKQEEHDLKYNTISVYDLMKAKNPDLDNKAIEEKIKKNKEINDLYKPQVTANDINNGGLNNTGTN